MPLDFSKTEPNYEVLADSIFRQEGGTKAKKPYGILSVPVKGEANARQIAINTARNNFKRWETAGSPGSYIDFLASRYVPVSADPKGNLAWRTNVPKIYDQLSAQKKEPEAPLNPLLLRPLPPVNYPTFPQYPLVKL